MGLIAVDKFNRKVLGYLCRNGTILSYCCVECDVEYEAANQLEAHMLKHELRPQEEDDEQQQQQQQQQQQPNEFVPNENESMEADTTNGTDGEVNNIPLSQAEIEHRLKMEYDLKPCSIKLFRFEYDIDDLQSDADKTSFQSTSATEESEKLNESKTFRKRNKAQSATGPRKKFFECEHCSMAFAHAGHLRRHFNSAHAHHMCFICAQKFISVDELTKHQLEHTYTDNTTPVIPCNICGIHVKDLKRHLVDHRLESAYDIAMSTSTCKENMVIEDSEVSTDDFIKIENRDSFDASSLQTIGLEVEYIVTSDSEFNVSTTSNIKNGVDFNDVDIKPPKAPTKTNFKRKSNGGEFQCNRCPKKFRIECLLHQHVRNHDRPREKCTICFRMICPSYIRTHLLKFHRPKIDVIVAPEADRENDVEIIEEMQNVG